jgi:ProP effector
MNNPMKMKPVLRLKLGGSSSAPRDPAPPIPKPSPPPKPAPAEAKTATNTPSEACRVEMKRRALETQATLAERFPACFKPQGQPRLPLKIDIHKDIINVAPDLSEADIRQGIRGYVSAPVYHQAVIEGAVRVDLNGDPAGVVTADHARWAKIKLRKRPTG